MKEVHYNYLKNASAVAICLLALLPTLALMSRAVINHIKVFACLIGHLFYFLLFDAVTVREARPGIIFHRFSA